MEITFDPAKREATLRERGLDFNDAALVFEGERYTREDTRFDYGEVRNQTVGFLHGRMVMVVWTPRGETRHIISMRKCNEREQAAYRQRLGEG
ncbi:MAG: BrnT family toxin [Bauldia sp.]|nr:BrnT family toxin [Bauldia sp.]